MFRGAATTLLVLVAVACGSDDPNPGPRLDYGSLYDTYNNACATCSGCCQNGQCMPGTTTTACGIGGLTCHECFTGQQCLSGTCISQTNTCSTTCNGCCTSSGQCVDPGTNANCGISGLPCQACTSEQTCEGGACKSTAPSIIKVTVVSATVHNSDCGYTAYDDDCDPYVLLALGNDEPRKSTTIGSTESPLWSDATIDVDRSRLISEVLHIQILDDDSGVGVNDDDLLGTCDFSITEADISAGEKLTICGDKVQDLKITFAAVTN